MEVKIYKKNGSLRASVTINTDVIQGLDEIFKWVHIVLVSYDASCAVFDYSGSTYEVEKI